MRERVPGLEVGFGARLEVRGDETRRRLLADQEIFGEEGDRVRIVVAATPRDAFLQFFSSAFSTTAASLATFDAAKSTASRKTP